MNKLKTTNFDSNIGTLQIIEELITDTPQRAETLNEFFRIVGHKLAEKFNTIDQTPVRLQHLHRVTPATGFLSLQDQSYIQKLCAKVNPYKATGHEIKETSSSSSFSIGNHCEKGLVQVENYKSETSL